MPNFYIKLAFCGDKMVFSWEKSEDNFNNRSFFLMSVGGCNEEECTQKKGYVLLLTYPFHYKP